jgi:hypothetical protein
MRAGACMHYAHLLAAFLHQPLRSNISTRKQELAKWCGEMYTTWSVAAALSSLGLIHSQPHPHPNHTPPPINTFDTVTRVPPMTSPRGVKRRLAQEYQNLLSDPIEGCTARPNNENNLFEWIGEIQGPPFSPYAGGTFKISVHFPEDYPLKPLSVTFLTRICTSADIILHFPRMRV